MAVYAEGKYLHESSKAGKHGKHHGFLAWRLEVGVSMHEWISSQVFGRAQPVSNPVSSSVFLF